MLIIDILQMMGANKSTYVGKWRKGIREITYVLKPKKSLDFLTHTASPVMRSASNLQAWRMPKGGSLKPKKNTIVHTLL